MDFAQDAWASFLHLPAERYTFKDPKELVSFLVRLAHRKIIDAFRQRQQTAKHNDRDVEELRLPTEDDPGNEPAGPHPTPSQLAIAEEEWQRLLQDLPPKVRMALWMLRQGHSQREIADCLGVPPRMIHRVLQKLNREHKAP